MNDNPCARRAQGPRRSELDRMIVNALRRPLSQARQIRILEFVLRRERRKRGIT
jgi:hypothetical protein